MNWFYTFNQNNSGGGFTRDENVDHYVQMIKVLRLDGLMASLWDSERVWFLGEELFIKSGGKAGRSP